MVVKVYLSSVGYQNTTSRHMHQFMQISCRISNQIYQINDFIISSRLQRTHLHLRWLQRATRSPLQRSALLRSGDERLASSRHAWRLSKSPPTTIVHCDRQENVSVWRNMVSDDLDSNLMCDDAKP